MIKTILVSILLISLLKTVVTVDRNKFRTCAQSGFCTRCRSMNPYQSPYRLDIQTLKLDPTLAEVMLINDNNGVRFKVEISAIRSGIFRVKVKEAFPLLPRFEVPEVLVHDLEHEPMELTDRSDTGFSLVTSQNTNNKVVVTASPFRIDYYSDGILVLSANARGLMKFEHSRKKKGEEEEGENGEEISEENDIKKEEEDEDGHLAWEESFGGNTDSKPNGPQAVAMDFTFPDTRHVYGVPEHADHFSLRDTTTGDPYRLYNLDVFEYEVWNPMSLYAAVPFMMGHNSKRTTGLFWLNAAETWIDVKKGNGNDGVLGSLSNLVTNSGHSMIETHWMSEAGIIDTFVLMGLEPKTVSTQLKTLIGSTPLPQYFAIAYHQCRWNYNDQLDVHNVETKFDKYDIPMDVMWLDIEHTDGKKYFTWDSSKFSDSVGMIRNLTSRGRKLVTIVDPHIKKDNQYWIHQELTSLGLYTKNRDGSDYEGWCWPGASYYPDFLKPEARDYFAEQYALDKYVGSTLDVYTWNDMNEPSVFNGPEVTMPKDILHVGNVEHRELHNLYGHLYVMGTHKGHLMRSENKLRPFILTRSGFAGTHRYSAIWTGDNTAEWSHVEVSIPMCLSLGIAGYAHCGSDVGGFFGNPDGEMFVRWYQAAAFQPFFRSHAHIDTKRREPWLYSQIEMSRIRDAVRTRYSYLPYWYTLFYESEKTGVPPMRPLFYEFPEDEDSFEIDDEHLVGNALLVHPVTAPDVETVQVYFPKGIWYDVATMEAVKLENKGINNVPVTADRIPVYQRGGTIVPKKERIRRSSKLMKDDPYTLIVALDDAGRASGSLFIDDGESFGYRNGEFIYVDFEYGDGKLSGHTAQNPGYKTQSWLERVVIMGVSSSPSKITMKSPISGEFDLDFTFDKNVLTVRKPSVNIAEDWDMTIV